MDVRQTRTFERLREEPFTHVCTHTLTQGGAKSPIKKGERPLTFIGTSCKPNLNNTPSNHRAFFGLC